MKRLAFFFCMLFFFCAGFTSAQEIRVTQESVKTLSENLIARIRANLRGNFALYPVGNTAISVYALRTAEVSADDPAIRNGVNFILNNTSGNTYEESLVICALTSVDPVKYRARIRAAADFLCSFQNADGGWGYGRPPELPRSDHSCTQYAMLGLALAERHANVPIPNKVRAKAIDYWKDTFLFEGGWGYGNESATISMTAAGLASLNLFGVRMHTPIPGSCGKYTGSTEMETAVNWLSPRLPGFLGSFTKTNFGYYAGYGLERAAILNSIKSFDGLDWYRAGLAAMLAAARQNILPESPSDLAFALLFAARNAAPVAITKWAWDGDWNRDRYDAQRWTELASARWKTPLDYQVLPLSNSANAKKLGLGSLLYLTGHGEFHASKKEIELLQRFLDSGGVLVAEPCCGDKTFFRTFRAFMLSEFDRMGKIQAIRLEPDHPVYNSPEKLNPAKVPVWRFRRGCAAIPVFLFEKDFSCALNGDEVNPVKVAEAEKTALNLLAWSLTRRRARGKLEDVDLLPLKPAEVVLFQPKKGDGSAYAFSDPVGRIRYDGDWDSDSDALKKYIHVFKNESSFSVFDAALTVDPETDDIYACRLLVLSGHGPVRLSRKSVINLRRYLENGGRLLIEPCCGDERFRESIPALIALLSPGRPLISVPDNDPLYSRPFPLRSEKPEVTAATTDKNYPSVSGLRGMRGEWIVLFSSGDFFCALQGDLNETIPGLKMPSAAKFAANLIQALLAEPESDTGRDLP